MGEAKALCDQRMLQAHHVGVAILRKFHAQTVAWLARAAVADVVGKDDEILFRVERLALAKQAAAIGRAEEPAAAAAGTVQDQDAVAHHAVAVFPRRANGAVVNPYFRQPLAAAEHEVARDEVTFNRSRKRRGLRRCRDGQRGEYESEDGARHARNASTRTFGERRLQTSLSSEG